MELALLIVLAVQTGGWLVYLDRRDRRHRDQLSELATRIQHPNLVNPRALETPPPPPEQVEPDERDLVGAVLDDGVPPLYGRPAAEE